MKKTILCMAFLLIFCTSSVFAEEIFADEEGKRQYNELLESSGATELFSLLPKEGQELLSEQGIEGPDADSLLNISFFDFIESIWQTIKTSVSRPLVILSSTIGIILLAALLNSLQTSFNNDSYERVFSVVSIICVSAVIIKPVTELISYASAIIGKLSEFILSFLAVYTGIITAAGKPLSAISYHAAVIGIVQGISAIAATVLVPLLTIYLAFCLIGAASDRLNIESIARGVRTAVVVVMSFLMTVFVGVLTIKGLVASAGDTVSLRTAKFAFSTFLPVVGSSIGEALNALQGCMSVVKTTVGGFGIAAVAAVVLPAIISILLMQLALSISAGIGDMLSAGRIAVLLRSASTVLSLLVSILFIYVILLVVSITVMMTLYAG